MIFTGLGSSKNNNKLKIKGFDTFGVGIFFLIIWYLIKKFQNFIVIILSVIILIIGIYGSIRGIIEIIYSLKLIISELKTEKISKLITECIIFLTKLLALILTFLNILQALKIL